MEALQFIEQCLNQVHERLVKSLQGLTPEDLVWRPAPHANCIVEIVWHMARALDRLPRNQTGLGLEVWESQQWYRRFGVSLEASRQAEFQFLRSSGMPVPRLEDLLAYIDAVHQDTLLKLRTLSPADLDRAANPSHPERPIATYLRHTITHTNNHHGQIDYIRGLMHPDWDLPPGTGMRQP